MSTRSRSATAKKSPARARSNSKGRAAAPASPSSTYTLTAGLNNEHQVIVPSSELKLSTIQRQIPSHYFKQNTAKGFCYVARDLCQVAALAYVMYNYGLDFIAEGGDAITSYLGEETTQATVCSALFKFAVWNVYWFIQGLSFTGLWVLAHECGHQAFSPYRVVNDTVGWVIHSALLVPYHSWRISHGNHHKHTNHLEKDTVFVPTKLVSPAAKNAFAEAPIVSLFYMIMTFTVGWPGYLLFNMTGQKYDRRANHFEPASPLFKKEDSTDIVFSDLGIAITIGAIVYFSNMFSFWTVACWYLIPYLWNNFWLVFITYLQHSDIRLPHYSPKEWNFVRGGLAAIDRDFGAPLNWWLHHINDSHVMHHLFSTMPFYNAIKVTREHNREIFGELYQTDNRSLMTMLWESWVECRYVVPSEDVAVYRR